MTYRAFPLMLLAFVVALLAAASLVAEERKKEKDDKNTHEGTFVSAKDDKEFTMKDKDGKEHSHMLDKDAKVIGTDGKAAKLSDLKKDQKIRVTTKADDKKVATKVEAVKDK